MGFSSQASAEYMAQKLEQVLLEGAKPENSGVLEFLGEKLYPLYLIEVSEAGGYYIPRDILRAYARFEPKSQA
ncbi:MAG: hypothetical protein NTW17_02635 [Candidatus Pacearchaeota archaeon]|nr:hypothetical protein [Candidatus Pacearchaeota archaeon]